MLAFGIFFVLAVPASKLADLLGVFTYVMEGSLAHRDSMGEHRVLRPNMIQAMSAGSGSSTASSTPLKPSRFMPVQGSILDLGELLAIEPEYPVGGVQAPDLRAAHRYLDQGRARNLRVALTIEPENPIGVIEAPNVIGSSDRDLP